MGSLDGSAAGDGGGGQWQQLILMAMIFAVFYFLMIRPQQKKAKQHREMVEALKVGDKVVTNSGIHGVIVELGEDTVVLDLGDSRVTFGRSYISGPPPGSKKTMAKKTEEKK